MAAVQPGQRSDGGSHTVPTMTNAPWFTPKTHGYGATPANWKGWAATFAFMASTIGLALLPQARPDLFATPDWPLRVMLWLAAIVTVIAGFIRLARAKTDGKWRWRWGEDVGPPGDSH
jgi:hypothetical protein